MNHKWESNKCVRCGVERKMEIARILKGERSVLKKGVFEDVPIYDYRMKWYFYFNDPFVGTFKRPDCKILNEHAKTRATEKDTLNQGNLAK